MKKELGVQHWVHDIIGVDSLMRCIRSRPSISRAWSRGYTGPGGKTVLPHRAVAKIDMRLVPDMTAADTLAKLKAHLAKHGFGDIEVNMSGGYDPTQTDPDSKFIQDAARDLSQARPRSAALAALRGILAGVSFHRAPLACRRDTSVSATAPARMRPMSTT